METILKNGKRYSANTDKLLKEMKRLTGVSYVKLLELSTYYFSKSDEYKKLIELTKTKAGK